MLWWQIHLEKAVQIKILLYISVTAFDAIILAGMHIDDLYMHDVGIICGTIDEFGKQIYHSLCPI